MKSNTLVSCAVAAAIAAAASAAHATSLSSYQANQNAGLNVNVYVSGSTAVDNTFKSELATGALEICAPNTMTEYEDATNVLASNGAAIGGGIDYIYYCQAGTLSGVSTNLFLAVFKESNVGSVNGAQPLIEAGKGQATNLTYLNPLGPDVQNGTCGNSTTGGNNTGCTASDFLQNVVPTGGIADVEASLLRTVPGGASLSATDISTYLSGKPGVDVVWGVSVSKNLFYALQSAEGLTSTCPSGNLDSPACAPSLSRTQIAAIYDRDIVSWKSLGLNNPSGNNTVYICRRDVGSGTEASIEDYWLDARCSTTSLAMAKQDGLTVIEQASNGNVLRCLRAFDQGDVNITPYNQDFGTTFQPFTPTGNEWAVGVTTTEITPTQVASQSDTVRMVAIDGVLPTIQNAVNGYDPYWGTDVTYIIASGQNQPSGNPLAVFTAIRNDLGHPIPTAAADAGYVNVWGDGGDVSPAETYLTSSTYSSYPPAPATILATPVALFTKASSGFVNNCDIPVLWKGVSGIVSPAESTLLGSGDVNQ